MLACRNAVRISINTLFIGLVAALSLAFGLAFGLGGRDVASEITRSWYESSQSAADKVRAKVEESEASAGRSAPVTTARSASATPGATAPSTPRPEPA